MTKRPVLSLPVLSLSLLISLLMVAGLYFGFSGRSSASPSARSPVPRQPSAEAIANVDMQKCYEESEARVKAEARVRTFSLKAYKNFEETAKLQFVTPEETEEFSKAINAEKPGTPLSSADTKKLADIRKADGARAVEYQALLAKPQAGLSAQDKQRMRELATMQQQRPVILDRLQKFYQEAVDEEAGKQRRLGFGEVRDAVQKLAKELAYAQVYDVSALVYAQNDMTDAVLRKVRARK